MTAQSTALTIADIGPRFSGTLSALSSSLILFIIYRSRAKLSNTYHRILTGMSCGDIMASIAIGLTTLPMPKNLRPDSLIPWTGTRLGTEQTCEIQGFFAMFGIIYMFYYNVSLCVYNTCSIAFRMLEENIVKYVEPFLHLYPLAVALGATIPLVFFEAGIREDNNPWCNANKKGYEFIFLGLLAFLLIQVSICFALVIRRVMAIERSLHHLFRRRASSYNQVRDTHQMTKIVTFQAFLYFITYIITLVPGAIHSTFDAYAEGAGTHWISTISYLLFPLQGFFNMLIFISFKIYNYRRVHTETSKWDAFKMLLRGEKDDPLLFSRISFAALEIEQRRLELEVENEMNVQYPSIDEDIGSTSINKDSNPVESEDNKKSSMFGSPALDINVEINLEDIAQKSVTHSINNQVFISGEVASYDLSGFSVRTPAYDDHVDYDEEHCLDHAESTQKSPSKKTENATISSNSEVLADVVSAGS